MRFTIVDDDQTISFTGEGHLVKAFTAACAKGPRNYRELLAGASTYDDQIEPHVLSGLAVFDEHVLADSPETVEAWSADAQDVGRSPVPRLESGSSQSESDGRSPWNHSLQSLRKADHPDRKPLRTRPAGRSEPISAGWRADRSDVCVFTSEKLVDCSLTSLASVPGRRVLSPSGTRFFRKRPPRNIRDIWLLMPSS